MASTAAPAGPSRKQNVACDACRAKKIRCLRETISERCAQCVTKGSECTSNYIESLQNKVVTKKRKLDVRPKGGREESATHNQRDDSTPGQGRAPGSSTPVSRQHEAGPSDRRASILQSVPNENELRGAPMFRVPSTAHARQAYDLSASEKQANLLRYMFCPEAVEDLRWGYNDVQDIELCATGNSDLWESQDGRVYQEEPSEAHLSIPDEGLNELAEDILDTFWSIAHIRSPLFNPVLFRERYSDPDTHPSGPVPHAMLAVSIAMGARFSDNPIIAHDRDEISERDEEVFMRDVSQSDGLPSRERERQRGRTRSRIVQLLVVRAREVIESCKTHRIATLENCQVLSLLEVLLGQSMLLKEKYQAYNALCSTRHAYALKLMSREHLETAYPDHAVRQAAGYTWWHIAAADGWRSMFNRLTPFLLDEDFEIDPNAFSMDFPLEGAVGHISEQIAAKQDDVETQDSLTVLWLSAANAGCFICRKLCNGLWTNRVRQVGIATATLRDFVHFNSLWRDKYIAKLGVPTKWPEQWDFLAAISSCSTDAYYHCLWMIVHGAIKEFGLQDERDAAQDGVVPVNTVELESLKRRIKEEAEHGAVRVASLVGTLTENGYLRLDPLILIYPVYLAGLILAESGKDDATVCVAGLKQYSIAYGQLWDMADEVERLYDRSTATAAAAQAVNFREYPGHERGGSLNQLLLAPVGHMGEMGPWGLDSGPGFSIPSGSPASGSGRSPFHPGLGSSQQRASLDPAPFPQHAGMMGINDMHFASSSGRNNDGGSSFQLPPIQALAGLADQAGPSSARTASGWHADQFNSPSLPGTSSIGLGGPRASLPLPSPGGRSSSFSLTDGSDRGKAREEWHKTGAGAVLVCVFSVFDIISAERPCSDQYPGRAYHQAANGFTALPMTPSSAGMPAAPSKDTSSALFDWLQRP